MVYSFCRADNRSDFELNTVTAAARIRTTAHKRGVLAVDVIKPHNPAADFTVRSAGEEQDVHLILDCRY